MDRPIDAASASSVPVTADVDDLREVRLIGRGGQGVVTAGELLGRAVVSEGRRAQSLPTFGPERRGALCSATLRVGSREILLKCTAANPDILLLIDPTIWHHANVVAGLPEGATLIFNTPRSPADIEADLLQGRFGYRLTLKDYRLLTVDATGIALTNLGRAIPNTAMMGALSGATGIVGQGAIETALTERFGDKARANIAAARAAREALIELGS